MSSTHFKTSKLTLAVIYGCSEMQMKRVEALLNGSPEVRDHPFLMAGIFAELQRDRVESLMWEAEKELDDILSKEFKFNRADSVPEESRSRGRNWTRSRRISLFRSRLKIMEEEVKIVKTQLEKIVRHMEFVAEKEVVRIPSLRGAEKTAAEVMVKKNERFVERFGEICVEMDSMMVRFRLASEEMAFAREAYMTELARNEAHNTSRQAKASTVIGFVAMLYLPITAMATIFATPVFDFKNDWLDIHLNHLGPSGDSASSGDRRMPIVSGHFWWYFMSSMLLSIFTVAFWWFRTKEEKTTSDADEDESEGDGEKTNAEGVGSTALMGPQDGTLTTPSGSEKNSGGTPGRSRDPKSWFGMAPRWSWNKSWLGISPAWPWDKSWLGTTSKPEKKQVLPK